MNNKFHILIVDDDPIVLRLLQRCLTMGNHVVSTANSGADALEQCRAKKFDIMIIDMAMPEMNGIETTNKARELHPDLPVIMLTGNDINVDKNSDVMQVTNMILNKPISMSDLCSAIQTVIQNNEQSQKGLQ